MQTLWSVKGGAGVTVTAVAVALGWVRRGRAVVLVDLCGDAPAVLGLAEPAGPGVRDWLHTADGSAEALGRLTVPVIDGLSLLPCGRSSAPPPPVRVAALAELHEAAGPGLEHVGEILRPHDRRAGLHHALLPEHARGRGLRHLAHL